MFNSQPHDALSTRLEPGEKLLWHGRPDALRVLLQPQHFVALAFGAFWTVQSVSFALRWAGPNIGFDLFNVSFVLIGIAIMLSPFWTYWEARRTFYAVSDKRVLIVVAGRSSKVQSYRMTK